MYTNKLQFSIDNTCLLSFLNRKDIKSLYKCDKDINQIIGEKITHKSLYLHIYYHVIFNEIDDSIKWQSATAFLCKTPTWYNYSMELSDFFFRNQEQCEMESYKFVIPIKMKYNLFFNNKKYGLLRLALVDYHIKEGDYVKCDNYYAKLVTIDKNYYKIENLERELNNHYTRFRYIKFNVVDELKN